MGVRRSWHQSLGGMSEGFDGLPVESDVFHADESKTTFSHRTARENKWPPPGAQCCGGVGQTALGRGSLYRLGR